MRCDRHALACGPDGRCILCRKQSPRASSAVSTSLLGLVVIGLVLAAGAAGAVGLARRKPPVVSSAEPPATPMAARPLHGTDPDPDDLPASSVLANPGTPAPLSPADEARLKRLLGAAPGDVGAQTQPVSAASPPAPAPIADAPGRDWRAAARALHVIIYTTSWCGYCRRAKAFMSANGVPYEERNIETSDDYARAMRRLNPGGSVPTFDIGGNAMVGFSETAFIDRVQRASL